MWKHPKDGTHSSRDIFFIILGLDHVYQIIRSSCRQFRLRIDMEDWEGNTKYAVYEDFYITDESDGYRLHCGMYSGTYRKTVQSKIQRDDWLAFDAVLNGCPVISR